MIQSGKESLEERIARIRKQNEIIEKNQKEIELDIKMAAQRKAIYKPAIANNKGEEEFRGKMYADRMPKNVDIKKRVTFVDDKNDDSDDDDDNNNATDEDDVKRRYRLNLLERQSKQRTQNGNWIREWDEGKEDILKNNNSWKDVHLSTFGDYEAPQRTTATGFYDRRPTSVAVNRITPTQTADRMSTRYMVAERNKNRSDYFQQSPQQFVENKYVRTKTADFSPVSKLYSDGIKSGKLSPTYNRSLEQEIGESNDGWNGEETWYADDDEEEEEEEEEEMMEDNDNDNDDQNWETISEEVVDGAVESGCITGAKSKLADNDGGDDSLIRSSSAEEDFTVEVNKVLHWNDQKNELSVTHDELSDRKKVYFGRNSMLRVNLRNDASSNSMNSHSSYRIRSLNNGGPPVADFTSDDEEFISVGKSLSFSQRNSSAVDN